ncbi:MAG TPA: putative peptidoglycan glycosyltransferase FtsW [Campylobacterales bacterium]|nr:putative peptidoglycan glycosyltransferase FtsW [Campylobacterales bacterium]
MVDKKLFALTVAAITIGVIFSYSLPVYLSINNDLKLSFLIKQLFAAALGIFIMGILSKLNPETAISKIGMSLFILFLLIMAAMPLLPSSVVPMINGAKRWINIGVTNLSPVEFFKVGFIYFLAWSFSRKFYYKDEKHSLTHEIKIFFPYVVVLAVSCFLIVVMQNDLGQAIVICATLAIILLFAGSSFNLFLSIIVAGTAGAAAFIMFSSYRLGKVLQWWAGVQDYILSTLPAFMSEYLRVEKNEIEEAYQVTQSLNAIHNGGIFGQGLGNGIFKLGYVSDVHTDFVLAGIIEEIGFIGAFVISFLLLAIVHRIFRIANRSENPVFYLFCIGIATMISVQFLMNALGISGVMPIKGITVPFISYGGSSLISLCIAVGMALMISKRARA